MLINGSLCFINVNCSFDFDFDVVGKISRGPHGGSIIYEGDKFQWITHRREGEGRITTMIIPTCAMYSRYIPTHVEK